MLFKSDTEGNEKIENCRAQPFLVMTLIFVIDGHDLRSFDFVCRDFFQTIDLDLSCQFETRFYEREDQYFRQIERNFQVSRVT